MVLLDHFANKSNTFWHSLSLSLSRSPISSHFFLGSPLPPTQDTRIPQLKEPWIDLPLPCNASLVVHCASIHSSIFQTHPLSCMSQLGSVCICKCHFLLYNLWKVQEIVLYGTPGTDTGFELENWNKVLLWLNQGSNMEPIISYKL